MNLKLFTLTLPYNFTGQEEALHPVIIKNQQEVILVDCGYPGFLPLIQEAVREVDLSLDLLTGVIITHHDLDHMGSLAELKTKYPQVRVYASAIEAPYVSGQKKSLRLTQAEELFPTLLEAQQPGARQFQELLRAMQTVPVDQILPDADELPFLPGVYTVATPGHMPGHISLYLPESKTLIAADALVIENGELQIANSQYTLDLPAAIASIKRLQQLDIQKIICYHGGILDTDIDQKFKNLLAQYV